MRRAWPVRFFCHGAFVGFAAVMALHLHAAPALAQGSTGGSIGKQDKSLSGGQDGGSTSAPRERSTRERERPSRSERPAKQERAAKRDGGGGGGGGGNFDGTWTAASISAACNVQAASTVSISSGHMTAEGFSGHVSGNGSVTGSWAGSGLTASFSGRISGRVGSGSWRRSDGCAGRWTMSKN